MVLDVGFMRPLLVWRGYWIDEGYVMSGFKGTPGPWGWFTSNSHMRLSSLTTGRDGDVVGAYKAADGMAVVSVKKSDADLIAAAPELLEALQAAMEWIDAVPQDIQLPTMPGFNRDWVDGIIAKALGRS